MRSGLWLMIVGVALLAGCSSRYQAPVDLAGGEPLFLNAGRQHLVNQGETLYAVAWMYDLDFAALARVNNLREPYNLTPGQLLTVDLRSQPGGGAAVAAAPRSSETTTSAVTAVNPVQVTGTTTRRSSLPPSDRPARTPLPSTDGAAATPPAATLPPAAVTPPVATTTPPPVTTPPATARNTAPPPVAANTGVSGTGAVDWAWPHRGNIVGRFADSAADNKGIDIGGNEGDAVLAAADGEVVYAGSGLLRYGNLIIIKHNDRYLSAYAHNRALVVGEKDRVTKGQKIAELGSSGIDRNMLHFEIRVDGKPSDPMQFLPAR
ncbi:MAG: peptidoglycan DD-metalloendopeptidase family protein [Pseudomonadota bacterium]